MHNRLRQTQQPVFQAPHHEEVASRPMESVYIGEILHDRVAEPAPTDARIMNIPSIDVRVLPVHQSSQRPEFFMYEPKVCKNDELTDEKLKTVNQNRTWHDVTKLILKDRLLESKEKERKLLKAYAGAYREDSDDDDLPAIGKPKPGEEEEPRTRDARVFHMGFPHAANMIKSIKYCVFTVGLETERVTVLKIEEQLKNEGCLRMVVSPEVLSAIADNENLISNKLVRYHWKPLHIRLLEENNGLPIEFDLQIHTRIPDSPHATKLKQQWVSPRGPNSFGGESLKETHYITTPGTRRAGKNEQVALYVADEYVLNSVEANRWLDVDEGQIAKLLVEYEKGQNYIVPAPDRSRYIADNAIQFMVITEMERISQICANEGEPQPSIIKDGQREFVEVSKRVVDMLLAQKFQLYNKNLFLMRVEDIEFTLTPHRQETWKLTEFKDAMDVIKKLGGVLRTWSYSLTVEVAYENYTGNQHYRNKSTLEPSPVYQRSQVSESIATPRNNVNMQDFYSSNLIRRNVNRVVL